MHSTIEQILTQWGNCWGRDRIGTEYPSITRSIPVINKISRKAWLTHLTDDECIKIEHAIMSLHDADLESYQVTMALYVQHASERDITSALSISPGRMYIARSRGVSFLKGAFSFLGVRFRSA